MALTLYIVHLTATLFMTGLIWFVQVVHYPLMMRVGDDAFLAYMKEHQALTGRVVIVPMLIEIATASVLLFIRPSFMPLWAAAAGLGLVVVIWLSTALLQVPQHAKLVKQHDPAASQFLVNSNWVRTAAWSLRAGLLCAMLAHL